MLEQRFGARVDAGAVFTAAYVADVFAQEGRLADQLGTDAVTDRRLARGNAVMGFSSVVLLDAQGRLVASDPAHPELHGEEIATKHSHLTRALSGRRTVSDVVPAVDGSTPIVSFALPLDGGRAGVLSGGYDLQKSPLRSFLAYQFIPGTHAYILDSRGVPAANGGNGAPPQGPQVDVTRALGVPVVVDGRLTAASAIAGTPLYIVFDAPIASVLAPVTRDDRSTWAIVLAASLLALLGLVVIERMLASRAATREREAESDQRLRLTVEHAPIGMSTVSLDGRYVNPNPKLCELLGYDRAQLETMTFQEITHPDDLALDLDLVARLLAGNIADYALEKRFVRADGSIVWARLNVCLVRDSSGAPVSFVSQTEDITEVRAAQAKLEQQALYDSLTGLANRTLLLDRLSHELQRRSNGSLVAVGFCDLDHFKRVNDSLGHHAGDLLLCEVSRRLQSAVREGDTVARMGGDEFVLFLPDVHSMEVAQAVLDRACEAVEQPLTIEGHALHVTLSAGLSIGKEGNDAELLLREADTALYAAKEGGRSRVEVYTSAMRRTALTQLSVESELSSADEHDELELHYQPIVELATGRTVAFEALVRWRHPTRGLLLPASFIEIAETSQLIIDLGIVILRKACQFLAAHPDAPWRVFVNVSPVQLGHDLDGLVAAELARTGVPASRLGLEITENAVLQASGSSLAEMERLRDMGVAMLMDDFGTGYTALSSVLGTPISGIKLDRSFIARLGDGNTADQITATVAGLVQSLGFHGVAEGIETEEQRQLAKSLGWAHGQGYFFARPAPADQVVLPEPGSTYDSLAPLNPPQDIEPVLPV